MDQSLSILPSKSVQIFATVTMELGVEFAEHHCVADYIGNERSHT